MAADVPAPHWLAAPEPEAAASAIAEHFRGAYGRAPEGVWSAPGRANLMGEHVDYNGGRCLPYALPHRTYAAVARRTDRVLRMESAGFGRWQGTLDDLVPGALPGWVAYAAGPVWRAAPEHGLDVLIESAVPTGAGVSSSAAIVCALTIALADLAGDGALLSDPTGRATLATRAVDAENGFTGVPTGGMDQHASIRSTAGHCLLLDCRDFSIEQVPLDLEVPGRLALVVIDTGAPHVNGSGAYVTRRDECHAAAAALGAASLWAAAEDPDRAAIDAAVDALPHPLRARARHVIGERDRVAAAVTLLRRGHIGLVGQLLTEAHESLRDLFEVSAPALDLAVRICLEEGALGARLIGAGFGGSVLALVRQANVDGLATAVTRAFAAADYAPPRFLAAPPSAGAARHG